MIPADVLVGAHYGLKSDIVLCPLVPKAEVALSACRRVVGTLPVMVVIRAARLAAILLRIAKGLRPADGPPGL